MACKFINMFNNWSLSWKEKEDGRESSLLNISSFPKRKLGFSVPVRVFKFLAGFAIGLVRLGLSWVCRPLGHGLAVFFPGSASSWSCFISTGYFFLVLVLFSAKTFSSSVLLFVFYRVRRALGCLNSFF